MIESELVFSWKHNCRIMSFEQYVDFFGFPKTVLLALFIIF